MTTTQQPTVTPATVGYGTLRGEIGQVVVVRDIMGTERTYVGSIGFITGIMAGVVVGADTLVHFDTYFPPLDN